MIGRRGFITGLISFVAAPAIVRAAISDQNVWANNMEFFCRTFDQDYPPAMFVDCRFEGCSIHDPETRFGFSHCYFEGCTMDADLAEVLKRGFLGNYLVESDVHECKLVPSA